MYIYISLFIGQESWLWLVDTEVWIQWKFRLQDNHKLLLQLIDLEYQQPTVNETAMLAAFEKAISSKMGLEHRVAFSQRKLEFLEDFGSSVSRYGIVRCLVF